MDFDDIIFDEAVWDYARATATPLQSSSGDNPADYDPGDDWQQNFDESWYATADVQLVNGQATLPFYVFEDNAVDGHATVVWTLDPDVPFGFTQEIYRFSENDDTNGFGTVVNIPVSSQSSYKTVTIIIEDNDGDDSIFRTLEGDGGNNLLEGDSRNDSIYAQAGDDTVKGKNGNDNLYGEAGNDTLKGGAGNDYLNGGSGNDKLKGESGDDILDGLEGDDTLEGGAGNDKLLGHSGNDVLKGQDGDDVLDGEVGNDTLEGGNGNDTLIGGEGSDKLKGGKGDDVYRIDSNDTIIEKFNEGTDTIETSSDYTLSANLENLTLIGSDNINGTGNALDNTIIGNDADNFLEGGDGNDIIFGDSKFSGEGGYDTLVGGTGDDTLIGGVNSDTLTGGAGADRFTFDSPFSSYFPGVDGIDVITDFSQEQGDKLVVSASEFSGGLIVGELLPEQFTIGSAATQASHRFIYDAATGALYFDFDGTGDGIGLEFTQQQIAFLSPGLNLSSSDILVVA